MGQDVLKDLHRRFDHTALKPEVDGKAVERLCREALRFDFHAVVVNPVWVELAADILSQSKTNVVTVVGFPLGATTTAVKVTEAVSGVNDGAHEIDMVANISWLVSANFDKAEKEIRQVRDALPSNIILKVIIEAGKLTSVRQDDAVQSVINGGARFIKTGTGFFGGVEVNQVAQLFHSASGRIEVKASGRIRTLLQCRDLLQAGATRLGSSSSTTIMNEYLELAKT